MLDIYYHAMRIFLLKNKIDDVAIFRVVVVSTYFQMYVVKEVEAMLI
jgi:hypothetical protein